MVLGAIWCPVEKRREIAVRLREIRVKHKISPTLEIKWTKVSPAKLDFYLDVIDYFFDDDDLHFRGLVVPDKSLLDHKEFNQSHDDWYYKMYFTMLKTIFDPYSRYKVYIDIKDTLGQHKVEELQKVLCHNAFDFSRQMIADIKRVRSHEVEQLQLADLLIGALAYVHRDLNSNIAKTRIIERIRERSRYKLTQNTLLREEKFNLLIWNGSN
jgi:hypothetical protein